MFLHVCVFYCFLHWLFIGCVLLYIIVFIFFGSVAADHTIGGCVNTFTPNLQAYGSIWLQALAHLGWVAMSAIRTARVMAACLNFFFFDHK